MPLPASWKKKSPNSKPSGRASQYVSRLRPCSSLPPVDKATQGRPGASNGVPAMDKPGPRRTSPGELIKTLDQKRFRVSKPTHRLWLARHSRNRRPRAEWTHGFTPFPAVPGRGACPVKSGLAFIVAAGPPDPPPFQLPYRPRRDSGTPAPSPSDRRHTEATDPASPSSPAWPGTPPPAD